MYGGVAFPRRGQKFLLYLHCLDEDLDIQFRHQEVNLQILERVLKTSLTLPPELNVSSQRKEREILEEEARRTIEKDTQLASAGELMLPAPEWRYPNQNSIGRSQGTGHEGMNKKVKKALQIPTKSEFGKWRKLMLIVFMTKLLATKPVFLFSFLVLCQSLSNLIGKNHRHGCCLVYHRLEEEIGKINESLGSYALEIFLWTNSWKHEELQGSDRSRR